MKEFFKSLLSSDSPTSSKRFVGLLSIITCIILAFIATYKNGGITPEFIYNGLLLFASGAFAITGMETIFKKTKKDEENNTDTDTTDDTIK